MDEGEDRRLENFRAAVQTMKLYRRADLEDSKGESLIEQLYVDPLPHDHILKTMLRPSTTFLVGRKGTGKSTVFQRVQHELGQDKRVATAYVDIKTVYESTNVSDQSVDRVQVEADSLQVERIQQLLLMQNFVKAVVQGIRESLGKQSISWFQRLKDSLTGSTAELFAELDLYINQLGQARFVDITGATKLKSSLEDSRKNLNSGKAGATIGKDGLGASVEVNQTSHATTSTKSEYSAVLLREFDIKSLINELRVILSAADIRHLYVFVDDFSELPREAMTTVVDVLLAPLNNWSEELVKLKIAAYPGRIYYGEIDKTKIDEINLDIYDLYGQESIREMETKAVDFTRRLVEKRFQQFGVDFNQFLDLSRRGEHEIWRQLFFASMGNPRTLGYILFYLYESRVIYKRAITNAAIRDAAKRYYEEKIESYFKIGRFLHEAFTERATAFSLKELLEKIVLKARELRYIDPASNIRVGRTAGPGAGRPYTSHFYVPQTLETLLLTLELNFFISRYYSMSSRDGARVIIFALNYGLCQKYTIEFGHPDEGRENRAYLVERVFDYAPILQDFLASNQEIRCNNCEALFDYGILPALRIYGMQCPKCRAGICHVINISKKYKALLAEVDREALLPATELGILHTLEGSSEPMFAGDIAGELDCSPQLVGWRSKKLAERNLVTREVVKNRRRYTATDLARRIYSTDARTDGLNLGDGK